MAERTLAPNPNTFRAIIDPKVGAGRPIEAPALRVSAVFETARYRITLSLAKRDRLTVSPDGQRALVLAGDIYRPQAADIGQMILDRYDRRGLDFVKELNGDFLLLLIDQRADQIMMVTDRNNSIKMLIQRDGDRLIAASSIYLLPLANTPIDRTGVACYLAAGYAYNDLTVYDGVRILESSSIYRFEDGKLDQTRYWQYTFAEPSTSEPVDSLKQQLGERVIEATRIRVPSDRPIYLSLTGGADSRTLAAILAKVLHVPDVRCFTYIHGKILPTSDEGVAGQIAAWCGYSHDNVEAFDGSAVATLIRNSHFTGGMADVCDEIDAWIRMGAATFGGPMPVMFNGDTRFLPFAFEMKTLDDILAGAYIHRFDVLAWLEPHIGLAAYREYTDRVWVEIERALANTPASSSGFSFRDMLGFRNGHMRITGAWRETTAARYFKQARPLLDNDVLDLFLTLPIPLRRAKRLFTDTFRAMFPDLFAIPRATSASYTSFWPGAIQQQKGEIKALIERQSSPLDDLIPPDFLLTLLASDLTSYTRTNALIHSTLKKGYRLLSLGGRRQVPFARPSLFPAAVDAQTFLLRALVLRGFLAEMAGRLP